jgi:OOP family OmpA-OmpF porin
MSKALRGAIGIGLLTALVGGPVSGWAQMQAGSVTLSPMIGGYSFDGDEDLDDDLVYGLGLGYNVTKRLGAEAMVDFVDTNRGSDDVNTKVYLLRLDALYHFNVDSSFVPYLGLGAGAIITEFGNSGRGDHDPLLDWGGGVKYFVKDNIALRADARHVYAMDNGRNNLLYTVGLSFLFGGHAEPAAAAPADSDGDGVIDFIDECPNTPSGVPVNDTGCPPDSDGDGVADHADKCPGTPQGTPVGPDGCPKDSDGDGVIDAADRCPNTPANTPVDANGCAKDSDRDGVPDVSDRCPGTPARTPVDAKGCPKDSDGDGVIDSRDKCPGTPAGAKVDARGCWVLQGVRFDSGKATLTPDSSAGLQEVLAVLKKNPNLKVEVQGHTDSTGSRELNQRLSEARAKAVKAYFTASGIAADRMTVHGFGPDRPVASNDTKEGRAQNRRVELKPVP